ncbi:unnamed protein product [Rotaria sordida]|uniref:Uncharacterized protein n=1 Tax=Rotaria sordida TaxID=392033 RepID=A0A815QGX3_9BILA|nr:unnamed protein product [Rotaria sordida]
MIAIFSACIVRTVEKIEYVPSHIKFSQLVRNYPSTLHCPCSKFGITYDTFVTIQVNFHQVCSSQFIQQTWIDSIFNQQNMLSLSSDDFRRTLSFFWQVIAGFCMMSNRTWIDTVTSFDASRILSPRAIAEEVVRNQVQADLNNYIILAQATFARSLLAIRRTTSANQIISALATNFYLHYLPTDLDSSESPKMSPRIFNNCSCLNIAGCPHPATFNDNYNHIVTIPGLIDDCLIIDGTLSSTLECYYNQTCLSLLHPSLTIDVEPLINTRNKYFMVNSTVQMLLDKIMIDEMISDIRFDLYYSQCNPAYCSYSYTRRLDVLFIITTIIGIFGGLSFALRFISPFIAAIVLRWKNRRVFEDNVEHVMPTQQHQLCATMNRLRLLPNDIRQKIVNLNLFENQTLRTPTNIFRELLLTRVFILMITILFITTGFYIYFVEQNQIVTIKHPSLVTYEQLYNDHSATLQCPCSQISISYEKFLNVTYILHQVCTSAFVSPKWLTYLASFDPTLVPSWTDTRFSRNFRTIGASYFQFLANFCSLSQININDALNVFINTKFINDHVLPPSLFVQQTQAMIESFIDSTKNNFARTLDWIHIIFTTSYFLIGRNINFLITVTDDHQVTVDNIIFYSVSEITHESISINGPCSCEIDGPFCTMLDLLYTNGSNILDFQQAFDELRISCVLLFGFTTGNISWWYNITYLENIQATYSMVIHSQPSPNIKPLNASAPTQFGNVQLLDLLYEMLVETWIHNETYYDKFYRECAPISCSYRIVQRRDIIVVLLLLISVCGGINRGLQIFVPFVGKFIFFCINRWKNRNDWHGK